MEAFFLGIFSAAFFPDTKEDLGVFYLIWMTLFVGIHLVWDWKTLHTPRFHIGNMSNKITVAYNAATFTSSVLLLISLVSGSVRGVVGDTTIPIVIAGFSGVFYSIGALCPYDFKSIVIPKSETSSQNQDDLF